MGSPSIFVYDCASAGLIVQNFNKFAATRQQEYEKRQSQPGGQSMPHSNLEQMKDCIQLAACSTDENLPTNPDLPADLFTSCLTTPIEAALRWLFTTPSKHNIPHVTVEMLEHIPGNIL